MSAILEGLFTLSMVNAAIVFTLVNSLLFKKFREFIGAGSDLLNKLVNCDYCLGFWVALLLVFLTYGLKIGLLDFIFNTLLVAWMSGFQCAILCLIFQKTGK